MSPSPQDSYRMSHHMCLFRQTNTAESSTMDETLFAQLWDLWLSLPVIRKDTFVLLSFHRWRTQILLFWWCRFSWNMKGVHLRALLLCQIWLKSSDVFRSYCWGDWAFRLIVGVINPAFLQETGYNHPLWVKQRASRHEASFCSSDPRSSYHSLFSYLCYNKAYHAPLRKPPSQQFASKLFTGLSVSANLCRPSAYEWFPVWLLFNFISELA